MCKRNKNKKGCKPKKSFYHKIFVLIIGIVIMTLLCGINIGLAIKYPGDDKSNIIATFSGLISVIATIILGVIAIVQTRKYKTENDIFNDYQRNRDWRIEQKELLAAFGNNLENCYNEFKQYQYLKIIDDCLKNRWHEEISVDVLIYDEILKGLLDGLNYTALNGLYYFDNIEELLETCGKYTLQLRLFLKDFERYIKDKDMTRITAIGRLYKKLNELFCRIMFQIRLFNSTIMVNGIYEDILRTLSEKKDKQTEMRKRIKKSLEEQGNEE